MTQGRGIIHISQVSLSLLDGLHAAVDGPHQGLLGQTLWTATWQRYTMCTDLNKSKYSLWVCVMDEWVCLRQPLEKNHHLKQTEFKFELFFKR